MAGALTGLIGGGGGVIGGASVRLVLDSAQFNAGLSAAEGRLKGAAGTMQTLGRGMSTVGSTLTRSVTVPIVAAGAVATKMALDFNKAFVLIQTLAGKTGQSIGQMKTEVLNLAQVTGQDPTGLANALYQVASAGKAAAQNALPILTQAAHGAAIGMGNVNDIASVLTATTNSYGIKTISAAQAMDVLTQATHDSAAQADALSTSIGPVIGIAAQVGVSFQQVAAAMAQATTRGISTERAATGLRFLLQSLSAPTTAAKDALARYGISLQDLQRLISNQGLQGTLQTLAKTFDLTSTRGQQAWKAVVGGARGAVVANTQVGKSAATAATEVTRMGNAAGITQKKFELWGHTITGQNAVALAKLKVAAIQLGEKLIPVFESIVKAVTAIVDAFSSLPSGMQGAITKGLIFAALAGPFLKLAGILVGVAAKFYAVATAAGVAATAGAGASTAGAAGGLASVYKITPGFTGGATKVAEDTGAAAGSVFGVAFLAAGAAAVEQGAPILIKKEYTNLTGSSAIGGLVSGIAKQGIDTAMAIHPASFPDVPKSVPQSYKDAVAQVNALGVSFNKTQGDALQAAVSNGQYAKATTMLRNAAADATAALKGQGVASLTDLKAVEAYRSGLLGTSKAAQDMGKWINLNNGLTQTQKTVLAQTVGGLYKYGNGLSQAKQTAFDAAVAAGNYTQAVNILNGAINKLPPSKQVKITADTGQASGAIAKVQGQLSNLQSKTLTINVVTRYSTTGSPASLHPGGRVIGGSGGIFPMAAGGFITQGPYDAGRYLFGEGGYSTFAGKGAEAVIPLNEKGIAILSKAMQKAGGGRGINVTINTQGSMNPQELAASVSRHLSRTIREEALV